MTECPSCKDNTYFFRKQAEPIAQEIMERICIHLRYQMQKWPSDSDILEMKRNVKSILVRHMERQK